MTSTSPPTTPPYGQVFNHAEAFCVSQGRELIRISLEKLMQDRIKTLEKKGTTRCPKCKTSKRPRGHRNKDIHSSIGTVTLERCYDECLPCRLPEHSVEYVKK